MAKLVLIVALAAGVYFWWLGRRTRLSAGEARTLLGIDAGASENEVRAAHRRVIQRVHPDAGGSMRATVPLGTAVGPGDTIFVGERWF